MEVALDQVALNAVIEKIANNVYFGGKYQSVQEMAITVQKQLVEFIIKNPSLLNLKHDN